MGTVVTAGRVSDEGLAARVRRGDERAFEELYGRYRDRLHRYCASILRQPEDAEEAVQSAMLGAYRALAGGEVRAVAVRPWLYRIAHNQCIGMLRRRAARPTEPLTGLEVQHSQDVAQRVETADELVRLRQDLQTLPSEQRSALVLRELSGLSHEQIALVLDETPSTVKQLIYQARLGLHAMADGRALGCDTVRRRISDGDGRVLRSRGMGAHLRTCTTCRSFREGLATRPAKLAALVPVAPVALGRDLLGALGGGGAAGGFSLAGGGIAVKLALVVTVGMVGATAVVTPRVIGETARPQPHAAADRSHAVPLLASAPSAPAPSAAALMVSDPPEVDAPPPVVAFVPPATTPAHPVPASPPGEATPAATAAAAADPAPAAPAAAAGAPASGTAATPTTRRARGDGSAGAGGIPSAQGNGTPPAHARSGDAPGHSGDAPGHSGDTPGHSGDAPGHSGDAPGHSGDAPGNSGNAPGHSGDAPGNSGNAPGHSGDTPGNSGNSGAAPGNSGSAPGQSGAAPGNSGAAPGQSGGTPPNASPATPATPATPGEPVTPASAGGAHGASADAPGQAVAAGAKAPKGPPDR